MNVHSREYLNYLKSHAWVAKRRMILARAGYKCDGLVISPGFCENCFKPSWELTVHHKTYDNLGDEPLTDLQALCPECHRLADQLRSQKVQDEIWEKRLDGWASKKYGESWEIDYDSEEIAERVSRMVRRQGRLKCPMSPLYQ